MLANTYSSRLPEDHLLGSDLAPFWKRLDMSALRDQAKATIDQDLSIGAVFRWEQVEGLILPFPRGDVTVEGEELDAPLVPGEKPFDDETDEESEFDDEFDEVLPPISDAAAARPVADPPLPDPSLTAVATSAAADSSLTANGQETDKLDAKRRRLADYKAMWAASKALAVPDPALTSFLEGRVQADAKFLHLSGSSSAEAVFYQEAAAQHAAAKEQLAALQEQVRKEDAQKLEEKREKRQKKGPGKNVKMDKYQVMAHMLPLPEEVQLAIETEKARRSSKLASNVRKKEKDEKKSAKEKKEKDKQKKKDAREKKKELKKKKETDKADKKKKKAMAKKEKDKGSKSKDKSKEPAKAEKAAPSGSPPSYLSPKELVREAMEAAVKRIRHPSAFEARDFGQDQEDGGLRLHKRNRMEALCQLRMLSESQGAQLSSESCECWDTFLAWQEQKWMQEFHSAPPRLGVAVHHRLCKWESDMLGKLQRSFADYVDAMVKKQLEEVM